MTTQISTAIHAIQDGLSLLLEALTGQSGQAPEKPTPPQEAAVPLPAPPQITRDQAHTRLAELNLAGHGAHIRAALATLGATRFSELPDNQLTSLLDTVDNLIKEDSHFTDSPDAVNWHDEDTHA